MSATRKTAYSIVGLMLISILASFGGLIAENQNTTPELKEEPTQYQATSPGHSVFMEYVGAHWCGPCKSASTTLCTTCTTQMEAEELNLKISLTFPSGNLHQQDGLLTHQSTADNTSIHLVTQQ